MRKMPGKTGGLLCVALLLAGGVPVWGQSAGTATAMGATAQAQSDKSELQEETSDRDLTYIRTRAVFQYDYKELVDDVTINRTRLKLSYAFGPHQNMAVSVLVPVVWMSTPTQFAFGSGDMEITAGWVAYANEKFRTGILGQVVPQTSSENLIGGASTNLKGTWAMAWVMSSRFEFTGFFSYKQSVHETRLGPIKQFEPDLTLNMRVKKSTLFLESDSYLDCITNRFAPMLKGGVSRAFGKKRSWVATVYAEWPLSEYARRTQEVVDTGIDLTWFPFEKR
jgi:Putative MetA-pathway of phenol degradation